MCVFENRCLEKREKKSETVGRSGFLQFYAVKSAIYIRAQIYIYTLSGGERVDDGDDEREEEEDRSERFFFVGRDRE